MCAGFARSVGLAGLLIAAGSVDAGPGDEAFVEVGRWRFAVRGQVAEGVVHLAGEVDGQHRRKAAELGQQVDLGVGAGPRLLADAAVPIWPVVQVFAALDGCGHRCPQSPVGRGQG